MRVLEQDLSDVVLYLCDTCSTLHSFLDIFPEACSTFHQHGFLSRVSSFYEMAVPDLEKAIRKRNLDKCLQQDLWTRVSHSRRRMVDITHLLLQHTCLQPILEGSENTAAFVDDFLQILTAFLQEKRFLVDYDEQYPVADDISLLQQAFPHLDETRTLYLLRGVDSAWNSLGKKRPQLATTSAANHGGEAQSKACWDTAPAHTEPGLGAGLGGAEALAGVPQEGANGAACTVSVGELESLLSHIKDLLPDLGEGFLMACLEEYGYDGELVINNILEDKLAPALARRDRAEPRPTKEALPALLSSRSNVFDDDEFDVFNRDRLDMTRVWRGRKQGESVHDMLNDKQHINDQRSRYRAYETVVDEVLVDGDQSGDHGLDDYDDEYDDTYDLNQVGANDLDEDHELLNRRPFTTPQVLRTAKRSPEEEDEYEDQDEEEKDAAVKRDHFLQDPAVLRERAEARRREMQSRRGHRPPPASHVLGGPKGRGQTQETVLDRRRKEMSKSRGANHNRRFMADRKRNKGMIPS
ncbi:activating signal cointegrator 1 complex subunit 2 isoform X2 [Brachyhypopomus gauderio]|uniref:activating signal cointegrator 1 complex subunit 2 isoform X2 n=1 Tax=Brachyhypopomus gauderio TaxID=698409 RepID=UPI0040422FC1